MITNTNKLKSEINYNTSLILVLSVWAVLMSLYSIATESNWPLEAAHAHIDDERLFIESVFKCPPLGHLVVHRIKIMTN